jgi:hypothetical protein
VSARCRVLGARVLGARVLGATVLGAVVLGAVVPDAVMLSAAGAVGQERVANATTETRAVSQGLAREIAAVAVRGGVTWIGYRVPMIAGSRQMCCGDSNGGGRCLLEGSGLIMNTGGERRTDGTRVVLEAPTEFFVLARIEGEVTRVRTFTPDCDIDAGGARLVWLTGVAPEDSVAWLTTLVTSSSDAGDRQERVAKPAITAIALHNAPTADRALSSFTAATRPEWMRSDTAFWLGSTRGDSGARELARIVAQDPSDKVREKAIFGLSISKSPAALTTLIAAAKDDKNAHVRGQALFWLAHKAGQQAVAAITDAIASDPDTEVKKRAVFALSQLPRDEGVPKLIEVARTNRNPAVRKQAMFWLGQSKDPRAVKFFEEILSR